MESLTKRERQIVRLIALGKLPKEIAIELDISLDTVDVHKQNLYPKINCRGYADVTRYAIENNIIRLRVNALGKASHWE